MRKSTTLRVSAGPRIPKVVGRYSCEDRLGCDEVFETWRGRMSGLAGFERLLAIKCLRDPNEASARGFERAAQRAAELKDVHIAKVLECGSFDGGLFQASEYVHGLDVRALADRLRERRGRHHSASASAFDTQEWFRLAAFIGAGVARGLTAAHSQPADRLVVHGRLSPANIILTPQGALKITDFGVRAAVCSPEERGRAYLSPEVMAGQQPDPAGDVYALGAIMIELVELGTGPSVEPANSDLRGLGSSLTEICKALMVGDPHARPAAGAVAAMFRSASSGASDAELVRELGSFIGRLLARNTSGMGVQREGVPAAAAGSAKQDATFGQPAEALGEATRAEVALLQLVRGSQDDVEILTTQDLVAISTTERGAGDRPPGLPSSEMARSLAATDSLPEVEPQLTKPRVGARGAVRRLSVAVVVVVLVAAGYTAAVKGRFTNREPAFTPPAPPAATHDSTASAPVPVAAVPSDQSDPPPVPANAGEPIEGEASGVGAKMGTTVTLTISSQPAGATVWLDGKESGRTPVAVQVAKGKVRLVLITAGHRLVNEQLDTQTTSAVSRELSPLAPPSPGSGGVRVDCKTSGIYPVLIDGVETGLLCPSGRIPLASGVHTASIYLPDQDRLLSKDILLGRKGAIDKVRSLERSRLVVGRFAQAVFAQELAKVLPIELG